MSSLYRETESTLRLAMFVSGGGTTMNAIAAACQEDGPLFGLVKPVVVIADRDCRAVGLATAQEIPVQIVKRTDFPKGSDRTQAHGHAVLAVLNHYHPDTVTQNGWLSLTSIEIIETFADRIFNQHPAPLDPDHFGTGGEPLHFGGLGIYGKAAHESVLRFQALSGRRFHTEASIHRVTPDFDKGPVVWRQQVIVTEADTAQSLADRVIPVEHAGQIIFLKQLYERRVSDLHRTQPLIHSGEEPILCLAKSEARAIYPHG